MTRRTAPAADQPLTRVEITAGGHQVVVESCDPLATVKKVALDLWKATDSAAVTRSVGPVGFQAEHAERSPLMPPELELPHRIATDGGNDDDRTDRPARH